MKFDVLTLFPEMFKSLEESIIGKAKERTWSYERNLSAEQRRIIPNLR